MNSTNKNRKEKELLKVVAKKIREVNNSAAVMEMYADSYYLPSSQHMELTAYTFMTIVDLRRVLTELWMDNDKMQAFIPVVLAAVFKNRPECDVAAVPLIEHKDGDGKEILPVYTYTL